MLDISIPCAQCGKPIRFGHTKCVACGARLSRDARAALHDRLAAASSDYRELQEQIHSARAVLLIIALVYAAYGLLAFLAPGHPLDRGPEDDALRLATLVLSALIGAAFLACWQAARRAPLLAILLATGAWLGLELAGSFVASCPCSLGCG